MVVNSHAFGRDVAIGYNHIDKMGFGRIGYIKYAHCRLCSAFKANESVGAVTDLQ